MPPSASNSKPERSRSEAYNWKTYFIKIDLRGKAENSIGSLNIQTISAGGCEIVSGFQWNFRLSARLSPFSVGITHEKETEGD